MKPTPAQETHLEQLLRSVEASLSAAGSQLINDAAVRTTYVAQVQRGIRDIQTRFARGQFSSVEAAATEANLFRNTSLDALRLRTSPLGLVIARNLKEQGLTLNEAVARYTIRLYGSNANLTRLAADEQARVYALILERSAVTNSPSRSC